MWSFYKHDLAFVSFSFSHPLHVGEQSVEYLQWVISIQRTKTAGLLQPRVHFFLRHNFVLCFLSLWYFGCPCLLYSYTHQTPLIYKATGRQGFDHLLDRRWARLLLDRRSLVQISNASRRWARADSPL